jgi:pre-rRNA-processing protein TSR4
MTPIQLGYAEAIEDEEERKEIFSHTSFPSKIGGFPVWLYPTRPLSVEMATCNQCGDPLLLLLQLYAPEDDPPEAFHRMIYVMCCRKGQCNTFKVWRSQLPKENPYYKLNDQRQWELICKPQTTCGLRGTKQCSRCHQAIYCSRPHQIYDWTVGGHRETCTKTDITIKPNKLLFHEYEIVSEPEGEEDKNINLDNVEIDKTVSTEETIEDSKVGVDKAFLTFQQRILRSPDQILRYARVDENPTEPLWVSDLGRPTTIPPCEHCGSERTFEFQILPQLLYYLKMDPTSKDALDWGTLLIYTCARNCHVTNTNYIQEVIWKQDFSSHGIKYPLSSSSSFSKSSS